jgi:hypothetical protein
MKLSTITIALLSGMLLSCGGGRPELPELQLSADGEIVWEGWTTATLVAGGDTLDGRIHYRGGISAGYPKHSLALKLDERYPLCGLPADKDWILNANYIDKTFMRHKLCYDLFRLMDEEVNRAPLCAYATLTVDGHGQGLYVVMQKMDASTLGIDKGDSTSVIFKEPPVMYDERIEPQDPDNYYQQTFPKKRKDDRTAQAEAIVAFLQDSPDEVFRAEVGQWFDLKNIADWQLLLLLSNNADGLRKNFFLYKVGDATPYRVAPWDYDHSFGRDGDNEPNMLRDTVDCNRAVLLRRLWQWPEYRSQVARRWQQLRTEGLFTEATLNRMIADNAAQIEAAVKANELLWPVDNDIYYDANHFDAELDIMREFIGRNIERLDTLFNRILENEKS